MRKVAALAAVWLIVVAAGPGQTQDLPANETFLREAREVATRSQERWHRYQYRERSTELHLNPFGRMGTGATRVFEVRPSANPKLTYRRMIEYNGAPVSRAELDRYDAEYRARAERLARGNDSPDQRHNDDLLAEKRARMIVDDVVNTLQFDVARREFRDGRPMIVVTFAAKPNAHPASREGQLTKVFRGEILVDEATREIFGVTGVAMDDVTFGGFIAKVYEGTEAVVERREVLPGIWMPTRVTLKGDIRALFRRARIDHIVEWFDYRPMP
jgi:hypothetical protein